MKIIWTSEAKKDLTLIVSFYNKRNGNSNYSKKLVLAFKKAISFLETSPFLGLKVEGKDNFRVLIIKNHKIFYKIISENIEIVLIWDSRQDIGKIPIR